MAAYNILLIGKSGTGKSASMRNLDPKSTAIINISNKTLPFRGWRKNYTPLTKKTPDGNLVNIPVKSITPGSLRNHIEKAILHFNNNRPEIKVIVVDDFQYMSSFDYFSRSKSEGWERFTEIGNDTAKIAMINLQCRDDLFIVYNTHIEESVNKVTGETTMRAKTIGEMVDKYLTLEGLFNIVLYTSVQLEIDEESGEEVPVYQFDTQNNGVNTCHTGLGMFDKRYIPNDMDFVIKTARAFEYGEDDPYKVA